MITAKTANDNMVKYQDLTTKEELDRIYESIKNESSNGDSINWVSEKDIKKCNREILIENGFDLSQSTFGADKGEWKIKW